MLEITIPKQHHRFFDEEKEQFYTVDIPKDVHLELEHSLISLRKWESRTHKPFLGEEKKTAEETIEYIKCMTLNKIHADPICYNYIPEEELNRIREYIGDSMTATWFGNSKGETGGPRKKETVTAEIVYYWMVELGIPMEYERWHLNQLITLIKVITIKRKEMDPKNKKKRPTKDLIAERARINAERRKKYNTQG